MPTMPKALVPESVTGLSRVEWARRITERWQTGVESILAAGQELLLAKADLNHGEWQPMIESDLPFGRSVAQRLMAIAGHPILSKAAHAPLLPPSWMTLYEMTKLPDPVLEQALEDDTFGPETERADVVKQLREFKQAKKLAERRKAAPKLPKGQDPITTGDFRKAMAGLPDGSVDLIFTDPPYDRDSLSLYEDLAKEAARVLRPGGHLIVYAGQYILPELFPLVAKHLDYHWMLAVIHSGKLSRMQAYGVSVGWKPLLWFMRDAKAWDGEIGDVVRSEAPDKAWHKWAQSEIEAAHVIDRLTAKGDVVLDPMCGSGTTLIAALRLGRKGIGIELDSHTADTARQRLLDEGLI